MSDLLKSRRAHLVGIAVGGLVLIMIGRELATAPAEYYWGVIVGIMLSFGALAVRQ